VVESVVDFSYEFLVQDGVCVHEDEQFACCFLGSEVSGFAYASVLQVYDFVRVFLGDCSCVVWAVAVYDDCFDFAFFKRLFSDAL
jgi:hypothetical protein